MADDVFKRILKALDTDVDRAIERVLNDVVVPEAKARCPFDPTHTHHLRDAIHTEKEIEGIYLVGGDNKAWYGHLVEYGSSGKIGAGGVPTERFTRNHQGTLFHGHKGRKGHSTGTMPPHPFLNPAFEANRDAIVKAAEEAIRKAAQ